MFNIGDRIAHPLHGAGVISEITRRRINGMEREYYVVKIPVGDMLVMIPTESSDAIGIRPIIASNEANIIMNSIPEIQVNYNKNWNKRYRENMLRIKSGNLLEVASVIKSLMYMDTERGLSTGEKKMLHSAKQILISEIVLSLGSSYQDVEDRLNHAIN